MAKDSGKAEQTASSESGAATAGKETSKPKQAVIVVHGMGEQRPMDTLRSFVEGVLAESKQAPKPVDGKRRVLEKLQTAAKEYKANPLRVPKRPTSDQFWIVPDARTGAHELSRIRAVPKMSADSAYGPTDFYELYYADLLTANTLQQFTGWVRGLLFRWPHQVPARQVSFWLILWLMSLVAVLLLGLQLTATPLKDLQTAWSASKPEQDAISALLAAAVFFGGALLMSCRARKHADNPETSPGKGTLSQWYSFAAALLVPLALAVLCFYLVPWHFLWVPVELAAAADKEGLCGAWLILSGWKTLHLVLAAAILAFIKVLGVPVFGDVARYVRAAPDAVAARQAIRERGVKLLETLHDANAGDRPEYERIVVIGHSLGSIVALDVLRFYWAKHVTCRGTKFTASIGALEDADALCRNSNLADVQNDPNKATPDLNLAKFRSAQGAALEKFSDDGLPWRISDFVTAGSPLTHAEFLITRDWPRFLKLRRERQAPLCPPWMETAVNTSGMPSFLFEAADGSKRPHHAALFAVTRWTAVYDKPKAILCGDFLGGGSLRRNFGPGIAEVNVRLVKPGCWLLRRLVTHTHYWNPLAKGVIQDHSGLPGNTNLSGGHDHIALLKLLIWPGKTQPVS